MSVTFKVVQLIDRLRIQKFFMEKDSKVLLNFQFDPSKIENFIDNKLKVHGKKYKPNDFEESCLRDLDF